MPDNLIVKTILDKDESWIRQVAQLVFDRYPGGLYKWTFSDSPELWKIHFGARAGVLGVNLHGRRGCVKLFYDNRIHVKLRNQLGFPKARRAYKSGLELKKRGICCPEMLGYVISPKTGLAMLLTELIDNAQRIDMWLQHNYPTKEHIQMLAAFVRNMHDKGVAHQDLSFRNILIGQQNENCRLWILDYEDAVFSSKISETQRLKNLHHLNERALNIIKLRDRMLFLRYYLAHLDHKKCWKRTLQNYIYRYPSKYTIDERR